MAKVTITIEDEPQAERPDYSRINIDFDPPLSDQQGTPAQIAGVEFIEWLRERHEV